LKNHLIVEIRKFSFFILNNICYNCLKYKDDFAELEDSRKYFDVYKFVKTNIFRF